MNLSCIRQKKINKGEKPLETKICSKDLHGTATASCICAVFLFFTRTSKHFNNLLHGGPACRIR